MYLLMLLLSMSYVAYFSIQINSNCNYLAFAAADLYDFDDEKVVALL